MAETSNQPPYSLKAGWICISLGTLAIVVFGPIVGTIICGPLLLISLILAVIGMAKNRVGGGIALFISCLVLPGLGFVLWVLLFAVVESAKTGDDPLPADAGVLPSPTEERVLGESPEG